MADPAAEAGLIAAYRSELTYLRSAGAAFARAYPDIAGGLDLSEHASSDPHVERLLESFAFLTARLRRLHDSQFPEISAALLGMVCPQLTAPVPSMTIVQFEVDPARASSAGGVVVPQGTRLSRQRPDGTEDRFHTCYPVTLWPIEVEQVERASIGDFPHLDAQQRVAGVVRVRLRAIGPQGFAELRPPVLRLCLAGERSTRFALHELLSAALLGVSVTRADGPTPVADLGPDQLRPVGFDVAEAVMPDPATGHAAFRLLQEYAHFPSKFLFFDLHGLAAALDAAATSAIDLLFLFDRPLPRDLSVGRHSLRLGCAPAINLFPHVSEPIRLDQRSVEYPLVADNRPERSIGIHSVRRVVRGAADGASSATIPPFYGFDPDMPRCGGHGATWLARRAPAGIPGAPDTVSIAFVDPWLDPARPAADVAFAHLLCTNLGRTVELPVGEALQAEADWPLRAIRCVTRPTPEIPPPADGGTLWRLVSHLAVNRLSLEDGEAGLAALREILLLHASGPDSPLARQILAMRQLRTRRVVRHVGRDAWRGFCRGLEVTLQIDDQAFGDGSPCLLGAVLDRFFGLYAAGDSFTQFVLAQQQGEGNLIKRWPPRTGEMPVL